MSWTRIGRDGYWSGSPSIGDIENVCGECPSRLEAVRVRERGHSTRKRKRKGWGWRLPRQSGGNCELVLWRERIEF